MGEDVLRRGENEETLSEYSEKSAQEIFSDEELEEGVEFRDAIEDNIINSNNVFGERREFCVDVGVFVL